MSSTIEKRIAKIEKSIKLFAQKASIDSIVKRSAKAHFAAYEADVKKLHDLVGMLILKMAVLTEASFLARHKWPAVVNEINRLVIFAYDLPDAWWRAQDKRKSRYYNIEDWKDVPQKDRPCPGMTTAEWIEAIREEYERVNGYADTADLRRADFSIS